MAGSASETTTGQKLPNQEGVLPVVGESLPEVMAYSARPRPRCALYRALLCYGLIACITFLAFLPSLSNGFTNWDDDVYVTKNSDVRGFTLKNVSHVFSSTYVANYQPLTMLTYMTEFHFFRLNPTAYHSTNLALHIINSFLVFALTFALFRHRTMGLLVALLFAIHPLRVESVAWIAERKDVLSALFYLLSLQFYVSCRREGRSRFYWLCALALLFSLLSKPMAVSQPFVLFLIDYLHDRKLDKKTLLSKAPFFALALVFAVTALITQEKGNAVASLAQIPLLQRLCVPFYGLVFYAWKTVIPAQLCSFYSLPPDFSSGERLALFAAPILVLGGAAIVYYFRARSRILVFGSLFYLVTLLPVLQIVPVGDAAVAERYTYIPLLGLYFLFAALCRFLLAEKCHSRTCKGTLGTFIGAIIVVLAFLAHHRCGVWKDSLSLWNDVISKRPCAVAYNYRGVSYGARGQSDRAIQDFDVAIALNPRYFEAYDNRGFAYLSKRDYDQAIASHTEAVRLNPKDVLAYNNRGIAYKLKGDYDHAVDNFDQAIKLKPTAAAYNNRGATREAMGDRNQAIRDYDEAIAIDPVSAAAYYNRGRVYRSMGDARRALPDFKTACDLGHHSACQSLPRE